MKTPKQRSGDNAVVVLVLVIVLGLVLVLVIVLVLDVPRAGPVEHDYEHGNDYDPEYEHEHEHDPQARRRTSVRRAGSGANEERTMQASKQGAGARGGRSRVLLAVLSLAVAACAAAVGWERPRRVPAVSRQRAVAESRDARTKVASSETPPRGKWGGEKPAAARCGSSAPAATGVAHAAAAPAADGGAERELAALLACGEGEPAEGEPGDAPALAAWLSARAGAVPAALGWLREERVAPGARAFLLEALVDCGREDAVDCVARLAGGPDGAFEVRWEAIVALAAAPAPMAAPVLVTIAGSGSELSFAAIWALGRIGAVAERGARDRIAEAIERGLGQRSELDAVRLRALAEMGAARSLPAILGAATTSDEALRGEAVRALSGFAGTEADAELARRLGADSSPRVRLAAANLAGRRSSFDRPEALTAAALFDADPQVKRSALAALAALAARLPAARMELERIAQAAADEEVRREAGRALDRSNG